MTHTYTISGMTCDGCRTKVEKTLNAVEGIKAKVTLDPPLATITMEKHIAVQELQEALTAVGKYTIEMAHVPHSDEKAEKSCCSTAKDDARKDDHKTTAVAHNHAGGKYYCPMHCEGDKMYDKAGDCPVCGMHLVQEPAAAQVQQYTCPMHPEVIADSPGSCPICGMDLVPLQPSESQDQRIYKDLVKKMKIAVVFTVPIFAIAMIEMVHNNPLLQLMDASKWNWVQLVLSLPVVFMPAGYFCASMEINNYLESQYVYPYRYWYRSGIYI